MTAKDDWTPIRRHYGTQKNRQAVNRAIRAECEGGAAALDLLATLHGRAKSAGGRGPDQDAYERQVGVVEGLEQRVRAKWGLPPLED